MRRPIIAGNWKMNTTLEEALRLVDELATSLRPYDGVERVVCPPFISLAAVAERLRDGRILVGAQNAYFEDKGAFTGEVAPPMLVGLCEYVILGHSERRQYFGDTDQIVNRKIKAVLKHGLKPIVCVGENLAENEAGQTDAVIDRQMRGAFLDVPSLADVVIAYEPVWA
ncbi:MAG: triosephosphate isomerase, partial [Chloroflexi bacterium]|nr:triosephosphate isomerase [Chloroflexota bacterium]